MDCVKDKFTITISDVNGIRQFTLHQIIKIIVKWVILILFVLIIIGILLLKTFSDNVTKNKILTEKNSTEKKLQKSYENYENQKRLLESKIEDKTNILFSLNKQVYEMEEVVGISPELNVTYIDRVKVTEGKTLEEIEQQRKKALQEYEQQRLKRLKILEKQNLKPAQISLINHTVPNGSPLKVARYVSYFGYRLHPVSKKMEFHSGIDLDAKKGTPIYATADGVVEYARSKKPYGKYMIIGHSFGFKTAYGHLEKYAFKEGEYVKKGDIIAFVGSSFDRIKPSLHYEVRYLNKWLNPKEFLIANPSSIKDIVKRDKSIDWAGLITQVKERLDCK